MAVFFQGLLRGLALHDGTAPFVEVVKVGRTKPIVDYHAEIKPIVSVFGNGEVDGKLHREMIVDEFRLAVILSYAQMDIERSQLVFGIDKAPVEFHVMVASA